MSAKQQTIDWSKRGHQLRMLAKVAFQSQQWKTRRVSGHTLGVVLQRIDDCIGTDDCWNISIDRLAESAHMHRATASLAVAVLAHLQVIDVGDRKITVDGRVTTLPSTFRIVWSNVQDFVQDSPVVSTTPRVSITTTRRCDTPSPSAVTPIAVSGDPIAVSDTPHRRKRSPPSPTATVPAQSPVQSSPTPPPASSQGKFQLIRKGPAASDLLWKTFTDDDLRDSVKGFDPAAVNEWDQSPPELVQRLYDEGVAAFTWVRSEVGQRQFFATCHHVVHSSGIDSLRAVLIARLKESNHSKGNDTSDQWATAAVRCAMGDTLRGTR